jgi:serine/threonine-protein kinase HipA
LQSNPFDDRKTRPFFAGLLPEEQNDFALLDHIGRECAGAVTFLGPRKALPVPTNSDDV